METALIVDDDAQVLSLVARWLSDAGYDVSTSVNFENAKRRILESRPAVLVVDVRLEGFNGIQLAILARQTHPETRIAVLSGWDDSALRREAAACDACYICKPVRTTELVAGD